MSPLVIAHRGASGSAPENTLAAFRRAEQMGAAMIELDVQLSRDGEAVVIHDWTLERTTDGHGAVRDRTLAELRALDAGSWFGPAFRGEHVPTLREVLDAVRLPVNVELKPCGDDGVERRALMVVEQAGALGRVVFSSFDPGTLERLRARSAEAAIAVLWEYEPIPEAVRRAERVAARALHLRKEAATPSAIAETIAAGLTIRVWTVNAPDEFNRLATHRVHGIFTDHPERVLHTAPTQ